MYSDDGASKQIEFNVYREYQLLPGFTIHKVSSRMAIVTLSEARFF